MLQPKTPSESRVEMTEIVLPNDANSLGNMLGGRVLHFIDMAAAVAAMRHAGSPCVTASFDSVDFLSPIQIGEVCILRAAVTYAGRTSMEVRVEVFAENMLTGERRHTTEAFTTFVAIDKQSGAKNLVPPLRPETPEEIALYEGASERRALRLRHRATHASS